MSGESETDPSNRASTKLTTSATLRPTVPWRRRRARCCAGITISPHSRREAPTLQPVGLEVLGQGIRQAIQGLFAPLGNGHHGIRRGADPLEQRFLHRRLIQNTVHVGADDLSVVADGAIGPTGAQGHEGPLKRLAVRPTAVDFIAGKIRAAAAGKRQLSGDIVKLFARFKR